MRGAVLNTWVVTFAAVFVLVVSLVLASVTADDQLVSRAGSLIVVLGLLLTLKHSVLSKSRDIDSIVKERFHYAVYAPDPDSPEAAADKAAARLMLRDEYLGLSTTIIGSVVWGYGDLILAASR